MKLILICMNYKKNYDDLIQYAILKKRKKGEKIYYEHHHIKPKSIFPELKTEKSNLVLLTAREHFLAHFLLCKIYKIEDSKNYGKLLDAFNRLSNHKNIKYINSRLYEALKLERSKIMSIRMKETRRKMGRGYKVQISEKESKRRRKRFLLIQNKNVLGANNGNASKVICLDTLKIFNCIKEAQATIKKGQVTNSCQKCAKQNFQRAGGFFWMYYDVNLTTSDYLKLLDIAKMKVHRNLARTFRRNHENKKESK